MIYTFKYRTSLPDMKAAPPCELSQRHLHKVQRQTGSQQEEEEGDEEGSYKYKTKRVSGRLL